MDVFTDAGEFGAKKAANSEMWVHIMLKNQLRTSAF